LTFRGEADASPAAHRKIVLYAVPGKKPFYEAFGFRRMPVAGFAPKRRICPRKHGLSRARHGSAPREKRNRGAK
jgi:hypothetical protein